MSKKKEVLDGLHRMAKLNNVIRDNHGNLSVRDGDNVWIKPSGMPYEEITEQDLCCFDIISGERRDPGTAKPSVDLYNHRQIYWKFPDVDSICHTHSPYATAWAIMGKNIECCSTEQADFFGGDIECAANEMWYDSVDWYHGMSKDAVSMGAVLLYQHGVVTFGETPRKAVDLAVALENIAEKMKIANDLGKPERLPQQVIDSFNSRYRNVYGQ